MTEIKTINIKDKKYPESLKKIPNPPEILYLMGEIFPEENCFAVVGTRLCSAYGKQIALDEKSIYPKENIGLSKKILETGGCLVSEYPPGKGGSKITFPQRNRIISGLSLGVLVVEAKYKSGSLITANFAKKQGKKIFAVPGQIHSLNSQGPHNLIKQGAKLVDSANDILKSLNLKCLTSDFKQGGGTEEEQLIISALKEEALFIEKIIEKTKLPASTTARTLAIMEIKGTIRNLGGNTYALTR